MRFSSPEESGVAVDDLESLGKVCALPVPEYKMAVPPKWLCCVSRSILLTAF